MTTRGLRSWWMTIEERASSTTESAEPVAAVVLQHSLQWETLTLSSWCSLSDGTGLAWRLMHLSCPLGTAAWTFLVLLGASSLWSMLRGSGRGSNAGLALIGTGLVLAAFVASLLLLTERSTTVSYADWSGWGRDTRLTTADLRGEQGLAAAEMAQTMLSVLPTAAADEDVLLVTWQSELDSRVDAFTARWPWPLVRIGWHEFVALSESGPVPVPGRQEGWSVESSGGAVLVGLPRSEGEPRRWSATIYTDEIGITLAAVGFVFIVARWAVRMAATWRTRRRWRRGLCVACAYPRPAR